MNSGIDTLNLISVQHELAMNVVPGLELQPTVRRFMQVCLRRLSVRRIHCYLLTDDDTGRQGFEQGPRGTLRSSLPAVGNRVHDPLPEIDEIVARRLEGDQGVAYAKRLDGHALHLHVFTLPGVGWLVIERLQQPLGTDLIRAIEPVLERLAAACRYVVQHERTLREVARRKQAEERIRHMAYHDAMTGLPNHGRLLEVLAERIEETAAGAAFSGLLYVDLDRFRDINESLGYAFGDAILCALAERFRWAHFAAMTPARLAGNAFVFVLPVYDDAEGCRAAAVRTARAVQAAIAEPVETLERSIAVSASVGIVLFHDREADADRLLGYGSLAVHKAKALGRSTVHFYDPAMAGAARQQLVLDSELRAALRDDQFELELQPQVDRAGRVIGAEALIRWRHPERGVIAPAQFIPHAEKTGLIVPLSDWVLRRACAIVAEMSTAHGPAPGLRLAVNLSASYFHQADFVQRVVSIVDEAGIPASYIELELTESSLLDHIDESIDKILRVKGHGLRFSIDDFGTGYSSLAYVKRLPIDQLKIDRSFVHDIDHSPDDAAIVETIIAMARHFGLELIAEGVETEVEWAFLKRLGCDRFQGFLFHKPMPLGEFTRLPGLREAAADCRPQPG